MDMTHYIGIDISCKTFDVAIYQSNKEKYPHQRFDNSTAGFQSLLAWIKKQCHCDKSENRCVLSHLHITMEATNTYYENLAVFLVEQGIKVSVVNPKCIKNYSVSLNLRNKTDKSDACVLARYCAKEQPMIWQLPDVSQRKLLLKLRQLDYLKQNKAS